MGFDDFFIHEKKDDVLAFVLRNQDAMMETSIDRVTQTVERYAAEGWRARVTYDFSTWIGMIAYEYEKDAKSLNVGLMMANYAPHRRVVLPGVVLFHQITHEQQFRVNGRMPPKFCDFEIWREEEIASYGRIYGEGNINMIPGPAPYMRIARVPFSIVRPDIPARD